MIDSQNQVGEKEFVHKWQKRANSGNSLSLSLSLCLSLCMCVCIYIYIYIYICVYIYIYIYIYKLYEGGQLYPLKEEDIHVPTAKELAKTLLNMCKCKTYTKIPKLNACFSIRRRSVYLDKEEDLIVRWQLGSLRAYCFSIGLSKFSWGSCLLIGHLYMCYNA